MSCDTLEIRWFWPDPDISKLLDRVERLAGQPPVKQEPRTDRYLRLPHSTSVGIKRREGRLEHKWLLGREESGLPSKLRAEHIGSWRKIAFATDDASGDTRPEDWIPVEKHRHLSFWHYADGRPEVRSPGTDCETRCDIEIATLQVHPPEHAGSGNRKQLNAQTLCLESEGPDANALLRALLDQWVDNLSDDLATGRCMDYPAWLQTIATVPQVLPSKI